VQRLDLIHQLATLGHTQAIRLANLSLETEWAVVLQQAEAAPTQSLPFLAHGWWHMSCVSEQFLDYLS
jgi:hypothetical protein